MMFWYLPCGVEQEGRCVYTVCVFFGGESVTEKEKEGERWREYRSYREGILVGERQYGTERGKVRGRLRGNTIGRAKGM